MNEQDIRKRNFIFMTIEGAILFLALTFLDSNTVIPVFIDSYTGSIQLAGLAATLKSIFVILPQILIGPYISGIRNIPVFITRLMLIFRPIMLLMLPVLLCKADSYFIMWTFFSLYSLFWLSEGLLTVPWWELFSHTIPAEKRGKLLGYQQLFSGIASIAGGFAIKLILENTALANPVKYSIIFGAAGFIAFLSATIMVPVRDLPRTPVNEKAELLQYFGRLPGYLFKNDEFLKITKIQIIAGFSGMMLPFVILFCRNMFRLNAAEVSNLIYLQIIGVLVGGLLWGNISQRLGNKYVVITCQVVGLVINLALLACFFVKIGIAPYFLVLLGGIFGNGTWIGFINYTIDVVPEKDRPKYLVLSSLITFPLTFLSYLAGIVAGTLGFLPVFAVGAAAGAAATLMALRLKARRLSPEEGE